ncbi:MULTISPECIES: glycerol-3-phosphate dehydrogenase/oxidase [Citrobacter]|uniref:Glycerol-3-phosphate dehydrogenase/oxidase n=1 Tax=Citrobacter cronae TaxID=1748967 RepID=A0ABS1A179_9ENTR|nr:MULTISPECIES: glycerol-3-phosphate dehydrogenase/oxidase [Citrobacter]MBJ8385904.1 glycerol-3-phosphate dehydrogenase/oxidase [Citrobacter cronae]MBJ8389591.1 glycerol-3-phosphate dehydrogenase/oxidase [Citrobacter cronae]MBQ4921956.1 glycerol-3-phosphate dehydrogenase/oxidase [Citrobacter werkmanii]MBQ4934057.1 glycerol-3-phosphate dehydrogenase/oxidase [Citrobacter werkmanii]MBQ4946989.1 glycerol-3-phosphate dehydrogenase/oxidase [Citrobacter werkmanii]
MKFFPSRKPNKTRSDMYGAEPLRLQRPEQLDRLESETYDILIVGGGVTGAYAALDASLRGYRVALIEKSDFASGTSSKSSKMVHGGLRYIEQGNLGLVRHSLLERQRMRRNARHLVQRLPFLFPVLDKNGVFDKRMSSAFESLLWTYDLAGGWREGILHQKLTPAEVLSHCPTLKEEQLSGGFMYFDARVDDARLTLALVRTAAFHGATVTNHAEVIETTRDQHGKVNGGIVYADGREIRVKARVVIMATGVWLRDWSGLKKGESSPLNIRPAKGVHVAIPWMKIRNDCTVTIPVAGRSRRATITRWGNVSYLGTTDEDYQGDLNDVHCNRTELDFLLEGANSALKTDLRPEDVVGSIAGCRPLVGTAGGKTVEMKRNHEIRVAADGLITIVGGKLTTSRHMAEETIDAASKILGRKKACSTKTAYLLGAAGYDPQAILASGGLSAHLGERYGTEAHFVSDIIQADPSRVKPIVEGLPYTEAEVVYAVRHELASTVDDVLSRRIRARLMARDASAIAAERVGEILQQELRLQPEQVAKQVASYQAAIKHEKSMLMGTSE